MAYNVITDPGNIDTINFTNIASQKNATVFAGLQDTDKNTNVLTDTLLPTYNISYDDSQTNWCSVTLSNTDDAPNTAKKISVSVTENTANNDRGCKIYLKYEDKQTPNYIQINQSKPVTATIRVYNNTNDTITGKHFVILSQVSSNVPRYYMTVLDTYNKTIPANSSLDVGTNTEVTGWQSDWSAYVTATSSISIKVSEIQEITDVYYIQNDKGSKQGNHYVTSSAATLNNGVIAYTGGASPSYRIGIDTNTSPTDYVFSNGFPKSIAIIGSTQTLKESFEYVNTLSDTAWNNNDYVFWLCLTQPNKITDDKKLGCNAYVRQNTERTNNVANMQEVWTRTSTNVDSIIAKKINSNAVNGATDVFELGDDSLRIFIYYATSENNINNATLYRILKPVFTKEYDPIMSGAEIRSKITLPPDDVSNNWIYGRWETLITPNSNYKIIGSIKYYIPIFVNTTKYVTSAT